LKEVGFLAKLFGSLINEKSKRVSLTKKALSSAKFF